MSPPSPPDAANILDPSQLGYTPGRGAEMVLVGLTDGLLLALEKHHIAIVVLLCVMGVRCPLRLPGGLAFLSHLPQEKEQ